MSGQTVKIRASGGGEFDCYLVVPNTDVPVPVPAMVLASAIHGVDADIRVIADEFAAAGYVVAAPDLFWRTVPGPLPRSDERARERAQPRLERIKTGERDLTDMLAHLRTLPQFNGQAAVMGFCYGGPYAIIAPKRLGYAAGVSCHGTNLLDFIGELDGVKAPVCVIWGDKDHAAPAPVLEAYRAAAPRFPNLDLNIFPGVLHGYMMRDAKEAFDQKTRDFSMARAKAILDGLRDGRASLRQAS
ncbi:MAG TPA: dienelactone hydrolase family protein [Xanthobacteraceae bacterium]|nr:dienelactone hydrolase family protein [Xanthobacteraceae bacterium]